MTTLRSDICPVLAAPLSDAVRRMLGDTRFALVYQEGLGDWRTYGEPHLVFSALKHELHNLTWHHLLPG